ncbi:MAG: hypothetical protein E7406_05355 [Ruminococcaceae bacterium]|nr:hypothetical protein [Oscillospiraceae bacterium]
MSDVIANPGFFKSQKGESNSSLANSALAISPKLKSLFNESTALLEEENLHSFSDEISRAKEDLKRQTFTVAVVGEFSRGKSTFINKMFDREFLPVANMPTTAILTRIKHSDKEYITVLDTANRKKKILPLSVDSWDQYIASDDGKDPSGVAFVGIKSKWLSNGIEIVDTPGAGDLESSRAAVIGDALRGCDGAIITISATAAMSMSEKLFIEERLISKKTPFLLLIITKLDTVSKEQRNGIIDFVKAKLETWNMKDIPVYVPYKTEMPDNKYESIIGMDKIIGQINSWISSSKRKDLTEKWVAAKIASHLNSAVAFLNEKKCLFEAENDSKRKQLIDKKTQLLSESVLVWEKAKSEMIQKSEECYKLFIRKAQEEQVNIIEKLQYDISHVSNLKKWWEEDYPYRLKLEMTRLASLLESVIGRQLAVDVRNFNTVLEKNFKTSVLYSPDEILSKDEYTDFKTGGQVAVKDISTERTIGRVGVAALSLGSVMLMLSTGIPPIIGSMGVGTGGSILSEVFFKKRTEEQREILKKEIEKGVPGVVKNAMIHSEKRIKKIYNDIISDSSEKQENWIKSQKDVIESSSENLSFEDIESINVLIKKIEALSKEAESFA